jgi:hypothetical protein
MTLPGPVSKAIILRRSMSASWQFAIPPMLRVRTGPMSRKATKSRNRIRGAPEPPRVCSTGRNCVTTVVSEAAATIAGSAICNPHG